MWMLFVVSLPLGFDEAKVTRYAEFKNEKSCQVAVAKLEKGFTQGEQALCMFKKVKDPKPKKDVKK